MKAIFFIYWLIMPFYLFPSGQMQIGDIVLSFGIVVFFSSNLLKNKPLFAKRDASLVVFVALVLLINSLYFLLYRQYSTFMRSTMFYFFNLFLVIIFRDLSVDKKFVRNLFYLCRINLVVQMLLYITGLAGDGRSRYIGTLNNPNQFAYFIFASFIVMYVLSVSGKYSVKIRPYDYAIVVYLIVASASMGVFGGAMILIVANLVFTIPKRKLPGVLISLAAGSAIVVAVLGVDYFNDLFIAGRIEDREGMTIRGYFEDRSLDRVYEYPRYLLFGAGEGAHRRFRYPRAPEMHSTIFSIWFYYGIIPFIIWLSWIKGNLKKMDMRYLPVVIAMLIDAMGRITQRQPFLWVIFILIYVCNNSKEEKAVSVSEN